jgi:ParB family transcriptional regulator, chromosome partitioning protein
MTTDTHIMSDFTHIPLNRLVPWDGNVRKTDPGENALPELAASIAAHGLLQSLVVRKGRKGRYEVGAGGRRLAALTTLAKAGTISPDTPVPCHVVAEGADLSEISLVENAVRVPLHPADEFDAFLALIESGQHPADIAARFGIDEKAVNQRLKLARVSPVVIKAYRDEKLSLAHVMAFAVSDDHAAQENVWNELSDWQLEDPANIRAALTEGEITARDRRVKFVTLKAYEKAGGTVRRDLFAQDDNGVFIQDIVLLESLVAKKLEKEAASVRKEGWKWVEIRPSFDHSEWSNCGRRYEEAEPLPDDLQAELKTLQAEHDTLHGEWDGDEDHPRLAEIEARIDELERRETSWRPEALAVAGAIVSIGHDGKADIRCGYVKPEDTPQKTKAVIVAADGTVTEIPGAGLSPALIEDLTSERSAALTASLLDNPAIALAAIVHAIALQIFYQGCARDSVLQIRVSPSSLDRVQDTVAFAVIERAKVKWGQLLPENSDDLFAWCLEQKQAVLLDLLRFCGALTIDAVQRKADRPACERLVHAGKIATALKLDMAAWFRPTAANFFSRITKTAILDALREIKGDVAPAWLKAKKSDLASIAETHVGERSWLPAPLRSWPSQSEEAAGPEDAHEEDWEEAA